MADEVDRTNEAESFVLDATIRSASQAAARIPKGQPGTCFYCGDDFPRVVGDPPACGGCRDERHLP